MRGREWARVSVWVSEREREREWETMPWNVNKLSKGIKMCYRKCLFFYFNKEKYKQNGQKQFFDDK